MNRTIMTLAVMLFAAITSGCTALFQPDYSTGMRNGVSSSLVDYLYPDGETPPDFAEAIPHLNLPLRVGLAFVPGRYPHDEISEATRIELLDGVKRAFIEHNYVAHIEVIPDIYLRSSRGMEGMQQVARLYGVDVMALVSYDQVTVSTDNSAAFLYWTIVGAYIIQGTNNEVHTFVDTAVFDVDTTKLLFRAPGVDRNTDRSTAIGTENVIREQSAASFAAAVDIMTVNLGDELNRFEERVADNPMLASVSYKEGYGGTGTFDGWILLILVLFAIFGIGRSNEDDERPRDPSVDRSRPAHP